MNKCMCTTLKYNFKGFIVFLRPIQESMDPMLGMWLSVVFLELYCVYKS